MSAPEVKFEARPLQAVAETAAAWVARRHAGLDDREAAEFDRWLAADPAHAPALAEMESAWGMVNRPRLEGAAALVRARLAQADERRARVRRFGAFAGFGLAAAAALVFAFFPGWREPERAAPRATVVVRPDLQTLPDGSTVELNSGAEIAVEFTPDRRGVRLVRGEALFTVTKNPARPFVVTAGTVAVKAVGTAFSVRFDPERVDVLVTEGRVEIESHPAPARPALVNTPVLLDAGARLAVPTPAEQPVGFVPEVVSVSPAQIVAALAWRGRRIEFTETPLGEAVGHFNSHNVVQLTVADPVLAERRISGIYWSDDPEGFARLVESSLGLAARRAGDTIVLRAVR